MEGKDEFGVPYPFSFESFSDYKLPGYIYITALLYKIFGATILTVRLPALIASLSAIPLIGYLSYLLFPKHKYISLSAMTALSLMPLPHPFQQNCL
jgi:4-amino-4-deoxy-L-arabinose transferase-like glycosyltransferase